MILHQIPFSLGYLIHFSPLTCHALLHIIGWEGSLDAMQVAFPPVINAVRLLYHADSIALPER